MASCSKAHSIHLSTNAANLKLTRVVWSLNFCICKSRLINLLKDLCTLLMKSMWAFGQGWRLRFSPVFSCLFYFYFLFFFYFFFFCMWTVKSLCRRQKILFEHCLCTVHVLFMSPTTLFSYLKIILLQCFQFSVFSFSNNKLNPNGPYMSNYLKFLKKLSLSIVFMKRPFKKKKRPKT